MDLISREVVEVGTSTHKTLLKTFPEAAASQDPENSPIDRVKLGKLIFENADARKKLNAIMRKPILFKTAEYILKAYFSGLPCVILDAPLLFEASLDKICSLTITVNLESEEVQIDRLMKRDQKLKNESKSTLPPMTIDEAKSKISSQMSLLEKKRRATYCIENSGTIEELNQNVEKLILMIKKKHKPWLPRNSLFIYITTLIFLLLIYISRTWL